eukprot:3193366-Rhodomonas_salina.5
MRGSVRVSAFRNPSSVTVPCRAPRNVSAASINGGSASINAGSAAINAGSAAMKGGRASMNAVSASINACNVAKPARRGRAACTLPPAPPRALAVAPPYPTSVPDIP